MAISLTDNKKRRRIDDDEYIILHIGACLQLGRGLGERS